MRLTGRRGGQKSWVIQSRFGSGGASPLLKTAPCSRGALMLEDSGPMRDESHPSTVRDRLAKALFALVALVTGLIVLGALVRAHEAGLACPDWPLCFGEFIPEMDMKVAFEFSHRAVAGVVSLVFLAILILARRDADSWARAGRWLVAAAILLVVQIILGALTVWQLLAAWTVTSHLITGNSINAVLWLAAFRLRGIAPAPAAGGNARVWVTAALALLVLQLILGGLVSSTFAGLACPAWPTCNGDAFAPSLAGSVGLHLAHRWNALLLVVVAAVAARVARGVAGGGWQLVVVVLCVAQFIVGVTNVLWGMPVEVTGLHSGLAALLVLSQSRALHDAWCIGDGARH